MRPGTPDWRAGLIAVPSGGVALFRPAHGPLAERRVARALMDEAATLGGGQVFAFPQAELLLGAASGPCQRAAQTMQRLTGVAPDTWPLPQAQAEVAARCEAASLASPARIGSLAALEAHCAEWPLREAARLTLFRNGVNPAPVAQRLGPAPLGLDEPELEGMAREWLCRRVLAALTNPAERAQLPALRPGLRLILDFPQAGPQWGGQWGEKGGPMRAGPANDPNGPVALLPLTVLSDPVGFARMAESLREGGWVVGLLAGHAAALDWLVVPELTWAVPAGPQPPAARSETLLVLGRPAPAWCLAPGILHEAAA